MRAERRQRRPDTAARAHLELTRTVVLVEGLSDRAAVETLARRRGLDLDAAGISVVAVGGAQAVGRWVAEHGAGARLVGLCDAGEEHAFRRALERDVHVCRADLEDELIRALGAPAVEAVVAAQGELRSFRTLQKQPEHRGRPVEAQLRRFMGSGSGRKIRYARLLVEALDPERVPRPLDDLLRGVT